MNILFICSRNQWRSRTAENMLKNRKGVNVRFCWDASQCLGKMNEKLLAGADVVYCME